MQCAQSWKSFVDWEKVDEFCSLDTKSLTPSVDAYNELCGIWDLFQIGFLDWHDAFPLDTSHIKIEMVSASCNTGHRWDFPFKDAARYSPCDSSTGQASALLFGQHVSSCIDDDSKYDTGTMSDELRDVLTPIVDLAYLAPGFFHVSNDLQAYLHHVLAILWGPEWRTLSSLGVAPVPAPGSGPFEEMRFIGKVLDRVTVDDVGDFCWLYLRSSADGGGSLACEKPRFVCVSNDVDDFLTRAFLWIDSVSVSFDASMDSYNDVDGIFESIRFLFLIDDMCANCPAAIRISRELRDLVDAVMCMTKGVHVARMWRSGVPPL